jgi:Cd2+/Zn2+-exporting ATPase
VTASDNGMDERALASLRTLGLSQYEARLYLGLLSAGPQNGNELSRAAGVPSSKVYPTLAKLVRLGIVAQLNGADGVEYVCVAPEVLLERFRDRYREPLEHLEEALPKLAGERVDSSILTLGSWSMIAQEAGRMIAEARERISLSAWADTLDGLNEHLAAASKRGVEVAAMIYGDGALERGSWTRHNDKEIVAERIGGRMMTVVADGAQVLVAHRPSDARAVGIRTGNPVLCLMVEEYLHHDFLVERAKTNLGLERWERWWRSDPELRDVILGGLLHRLPRPDAAAESG